jgi:hypothetical protein
MQHSLSQNAAPGDLLPLIRAHAEPAALRGIFEEIRRDPARLAEVAARSYEHENGFAKVVLHEAGGSKLRLHVWRPGLGVPAQENIHDHRWDFASAVICGVLRSDEFAPSGTSHGERCHAYRYQRVEGSADYRLESIGRLRLARTQSRRIHAGESYYLHHSVMHRIVHDHPGVTATLVLTGEPVAADCGLYASRPMPARGSPQQRRLEPEELARLFTLVETTR